MRKVLLSVFILFSFNLSFSQSPYEVSFKKDGIILGAGVLNAVGSSFFSDSLKKITIDEINKLDRNSVNFLDRIATYNYSPDVSTASDYLVGTLIASPILLFLDKKMSSDWSKISLMYVENILFATFFPSWTKESVKRIRPLTYTDKAPIDVKVSEENRRSFFSGHTTMAFASAVFLSKVYNDYYPESNSRYYVWAGALTAATIVGTLRIVAGAHFPTDVIVGAAVGSACGYLIPELHKISSSSSTNLNITPISVSFSYKF
jgi:hypothetical protein